MVPAVIETPEGDFIGPARKKMFCLTVMIIE